MMNVSPTVDTLVFAFFTGVSNIFFRHNNWIDEDCGPRRLEQ